MAVRWQVDGNEANEPDVITSKRSKYLISGKFAADRLTGTSKPVKRIIFFKEAQFSGLVFTGVLLPVRVCISLVSPIQTFVLSVHLTLCLLTRLPKGQSPGELLNCTQTLNNHVIRFRLGVVLSTK